jgi:hypothetical protein
LKESLCACCVVERCSGCGKHFGVYGSGISFIETKSLYHLGGGGH